MKTIERIKEIMNERGIKQTELAKSLGIGKTTINAWFNNNSDPKIEQLEQIAKRLEVSIEYLVTGKESNTSYSLEERQLIGEYRSADGTGKARIMEYARDMARIHPAHSERAREPETEANIS
ncbi:MAG: helix-turn-helix transcriptional regulator [Lachnospiraceae bacterium]|nr:helix-turn-helix transcriptional regulator [Lachnospiraceae bacterium]